MATLDLPQTFTPFEGKIDEEEGMIRGVSIIQEGPALGHGVFVDRKTLSQVKALAQERGRLKAKVNHYSGLEATVGYYEDFRVRGNKLLADLRVFKTFKDRSTLFEMVKEIPNQFGVSITFDADTPEEDKTTGQYMTRLKRLYSADLVDTPAANRDGIFEQTVDTDSGDMGKETTPTPEPISIEALNAFVAKLDEAFQKRFEALEAKFSEIIKVGETVEAVTVSEKPDMKALAAELVEAIKLSQAAPATPKAEVGTPKPEQPPPQPKTYEEARKEAIGDTTGRAKYIAAMAFDRKYPTAEAFATAQK